MNWLQHWFFERQPPVDHKVLLTQRQIYILPTFFSVVFWCVITVIMLISINYQNALASGLAFFLISIWLTCIFYCHSNIRGLEISCKPSDYVMAGEMAKQYFQIHAKHLNKRALWFSFRNKNPDWTLSKNGCLELCLRTKSRGWLTLPHLTVETRCPIGLWRAWSHIRFNCALLVYPKAKHGECPMNLDLPNAKQNAILMQGLSSEDDFQGVKKKPPNESYRRVNWRVTAKTGQFLINDFVNMEEKKFGLDFDRTKGAFDDRLGVLVYWVLKLQTLNASFSLKLPNQLIDFNHGQEHVQQCLKALALFEYR